MICNFSFFCLFRANIWFLFVFISLFLLKKNTSKNKLILFIFVFTLLVLTLPELLSLAVFILSFFSVPFVLFCLFMFPLLMFNCSSYVYLFSLMFLLFVFIPFFLHCSSLFLRPFFLTPLSRRFSSGFSILFFRTRIYPFFMKKSLKTLNFWENLFFLCKNCQRNCWCNKQFCPDLICGNVHVFWTSIKMSSLFRKVFQKSYPSCVFFFEILSSQ